LSFHAAQSNRPENLDPEPRHRRLIGNSRIGYPAQARDAPRLEQMHWEKRAAPASPIFLR